AAEALETTRRVRRSPGLLAGSILALGAVLLLGAGAWWQFLNVVPAYSPPIAVMPVPNAYDDYRAAAFLLPPSGPSPSDLRHASREELRALVQAAGPALARLRKGFPHEFRNPPCRSWTQTFPELPGYRHLGRSLYAAGMLAEREGRYADAARSY